MYFSEPFKSSPHSVASPSGEYIATLLPSTGVVVRSTTSLGIIRTIKLPSDLSGSVTNLLWSPSSTAVLIVGTAHLHIFSIPAGDFHGVVQVPQPLTAKPAYVSFGATDNEACIWSSFGIKLTIVDIKSSKAVEISNPKFYNAASTWRGCSFRSRTHHLALLTRVSGKDMISIHSSQTREIQRSWSPDTIDAQGLEWTPDGRWLAVWESQAHGSRIVFYTPDGHVFHDWRGGHQLPALDDMDQYGSGIKVLAFSPNGKYTAVANGSDNICVLGDWFVESMRLRHPQTVEPSNTLKIWQEHAQTRNGQSIGSAFTMAVQAVSPPGLLSNNASDTRFGCNLVKFDSSSSLLATRLDAAPSTIWIWDVSSSELRAVLMYHANVTKVEWHPSQPELLMMRCEGEGDGHSGRAFVWDPLSDGPCPIDFSRHLDCPKITGKTEATWLKVHATESAAIFFTNHQAGIVVSLTDATKEPWGNPSAAPTNPDHAHDSFDGGFESDMDAAISDMDDTFHFKKSPCS
ncbi:hypothetical protein F5Y16DRAFT_231094 [Xylariaceae sp. FL0255]|nr:hypothetical protein F5Y16DRAFT_231094 [Xylariaceae sp. FL0255]